MTAPLSFPSFVAGVLGLVAAACARPQYTSEHHAALQTPVTLGEGNTGKPPLPPEETPSSKAAPTQGVAAAAFDPSAQPDPPPADTNAYWEVRLRHCNGNVHVEGAKKVSLDRPTTLPSKMGRFAVELWIGRELLERARFDFPLLAAETNEPGLHAPAQFGPNADVSWMVLVAERERTTRAWVVDRLTGTRWDLDWPPGDGRPAAPSSNRGDVPCPELPRKPQ